MAVLVALVAVTGAGMTFVKWELAPADSGKVTIGTRDDVYYSRSVTEKEARGLGEKLKDIGYFTDRGVTVFLAKDSSGTVVSFAVKDGAWEQPEMVLAFEQIGGSVARLLGESPSVMSAIEEDPGSWKLWDTYLEPMQESLKEKFGDQKGKLDTDLRPEFNRGWGPDPD